MKWNTLYNIRVGLWGLMFASALFALYGCYNTQTAKTAETDSAEPIWQVSLTINGGLSGQSRSISINHQGVAQFTDHLTKTQKNGQISITSLNKLVELVKYYSSTVTSSGVPSGGKPIPCRDCFQYTIKIEYDGKTTRQQVSDLNMDENLRQLIGALKTISSEHALQNK